MNKFGYELVNVDGLYAYVGVCLLYHSPCFCIFLKLLIVKELKVA